VPCGGVAKLFVDNPDLYKRTGPILWQADFGDTSGVQLQLFQKGIIVGPIFIDPPSRTAESQDGMVYAFWYGSDHTRGEWDSQRSKRNYQAPGAMALRRTDAYRWKCN
jgi:hypothetical protein